MREIDHNVEIDKLENQRDRLLDRIEKLEAERDELKTQLDAWQSVFGTSQLTHAQARLQAAEEKVRRMEYENKKK